MWGSIRKEMSVVEFQHTMLEHCHVPCLWISENGTHHGIAVVMPKVLEGSQADSGHIACFCLQMSR